MFANINLLSRQYASKLTPSFRDRRSKTTQPSYHRNQQYSIIGLTNAAGTLVERYSYTAYGTLGIYDASGTVRTTSTYANCYTYTGREYDPDLNLYHFRARWYDPATGGFISRDPLGYVDGMSLHRGYFGLVQSDPTGLFTIEEVFFKHCNEWCTPTRRRELPNCWATCKETQLCSAFKVWIRMEKELGEWWTSLEKCPCSLDSRTIECRSLPSRASLGSTYYVDEWVAPNDKWLKPSVPSAAEAALHPGAAISMRTKEGPRYNQCIYDSSGKLMTGLPSAGTVDYEKSGLRMDHYHHDVYPIIVANYCDGGILHNFWGMISGSIKMRDPAGENVKLYYKVRPHLAENCPENPPPVVSSPIPASIPSPSVDRGERFPDGFTARNGTWRPRSVRGTSGKTVYRRRGPREFQVLLAISDSKDNLGALTLAAYCSFVY